jgi:hypothetical protein
MDKLITALAPVFAAGLGIQQLTEILDPILDKIASDYKKVFLGVVSLAAGLALAFGAELQVLHLLGILEPDKRAFLDAVLTGLIISGGTEGINSILKFLKYKKEETKNEAASKTPTDGNAANAALVPVPSAAALKAINQK